jgi:hypothetical protein
MEAPFKITPNRSQYRPIYYPFNEGSDNTCELPATPHIFVHTTIDWRLPHPPYAGDRNVKSPLSRPYSDMMIVKTGLKEK